MNANELIHRLPSVFDPAAAGDLAMTVQYMIEAPVYVTIARGRCSAHDGMIASPDVTLRIKDRHLVKLMLGQMYGITAFLTGRLKIEGNYLLAQKLQSVFDTSRLGD